MKTRIKQATLPTFKTEAVTRRTECQSQNTGLSNYTWTKKEHAAISSWVHYTK